MSQPAHVEDAAREALPAPESAQMGQAHPEHVPVAAAEVPTHPRSEIKPPESAAVANDNAAIMPTEPTLPPPPPKAEGLAPQETHPMSREQIIEQNLAKYFAQKLPAELTKDLKITIIADPSNRVTSNSTTLDGQMDVAMLFTGEALEKHETAIALRNALVEALNAHPAFAAFKLNGEDRDVLHTLNISMTGLTKERVAELLKPLHAANDVGQDTATVPVVATAALDAAPAGSPEHSAQCSGCATCAPAKQETAETATNPVTTITKPVARDIAASLGASGIMGAAR